MNSEYGVGATGTTLRARLRMVRAVRHELEGLQSVDLAVPDAEVASLWRDREEPWTDILIQCLDLRIRLHLFPDEESVESLRTEASLAQMYRVLWRWPETTAVGLVANDNKLQTVLLEPFDSRESLQAPSGISGAVHITGGPGPIREVVQNYLASLTPDWPDVPRIGSSTYVDLTGMVGDAVERASAEANEEAKRVRTPSKKRALQSITKAEQEALRELALRIIAGGEEEQLEEALTEVTGEIE